MPEKIKKNEEEWRRQLTPEQYHILREKGTEPAFTGEYAHTQQEGVYRCAACGQELFPADAKFESGSGWPSFYRPISQSSVAARQDHSHGMRRVEVTCSRCDSHLAMCFPMARVPLDCATASTPHHSSLRRHAGVRTLSPAKGTGPAAEILSGVQQSRRILRRLADVRSLSPAKGTGARVPRTRRSCAFWGVRAHSRNPERSAAESLRSLGGIRACRWFWGWTIENARRLPSTQLLGPSLVRGHTGLLHRRG